MQNLLNSICKIAREYERLGARAHQLCLTIVSKLGGGLTSAFFGARSTKK
jgi:hypothetical protein